MKYFGITETYDPCFVANWETRLLEANVIISKELSDEMIEKLLIVQDRVIFHHTVTGQGGSVLEPNVKDTQHEFNQFVKLFERGFDITHYVLRIDPMIMINPDSMTRIFTVLTLWRDFVRTHNLPKLRVRVSIIDLYEHSIKRMQSAGVELAWTSFTAPQIVFDKAAEILQEYFDVFIFECCAEQKFKNNFIERCGCVSFKDLEILKLDKSEYGAPTSKQRQSCMCLAKKQILGVKPGRCQHQCLYCFWYDNN